MALDPWIGPGPHLRPIDLPGYRLDGLEQLDLARAAAIGLLLIPGWWALFGLLLGATGQWTAFDPSIGWTDVLPAIPVFVATLALHELVHGAAVLCSGHRPAFGLGPGFAYTTVHAPLSKPQYLLVVIGPLLFINLFALASAIMVSGWSGWALFVSLVNASGAGGDLWMAWRIAPLPPEIRLVDLADGYAVYLPERD